MAVTRDSILSEITTEVTAATSGTLHSAPLTDAQIVDCFNAVLNSLYTVDPTKKPTVRHITDLSFS